jgi:hypothetical protein
VTVAERNPTLSVYELTLLFDDHPTVPLVVAICDQTLPQTNRQLLRAMYGVPQIGNLPEWFLDRITEEQCAVIDLGLGIWRQNRQLAGR